jgi:ribose 5-phosphate isomerase B
MAGKLIAEADIVAASKKGLRSLVIERTAIVTPSARDAAARLKIELVPAGSSAGTATFVDSVVVHEPSGSPAKYGKVIAIGSDHGGYALKRLVRQHVLDLGWSVADVGTHSEQACDYPDFAYAVATMVAAGQAERGIMIDSVGVASAIVCNKVPGIRAVAAFNELAARSSREHNDANVLTLGGKVLGNETAKAIVNAWLETWFGGGRHKARLDKISDIERRFSKGP